MMRRRWCSFGDGPGIPPRERDGGRGRRPCTRVGSWLLALGLLLALRPSRAWGDQPEQPQPEQSRGWLELAFISSIRGPLGPLALSLAVRPPPLPRWAVGLALGHSPSQSAWGHDDDPRWALFVRSDVVHEPRYRLGLGLLYSTGSYYWSGTPSDTQVSDWYWFRAKRLDATIAGELVFGNLALRLEAGVGRMLAEPTNANNGPKGSPPRWFPTLQLAVAVRPGIGQPEAAMAVPAPRKVFRIFAAGTTLVEGGAGCDCAYEYNARYALGVEADVLVQMSAHWRMGVGGRFDFGRGEAAIGHDPTALIGFIPILLAPFYRWEQTGEELELALGLGPSLGKLGVSGSSDAAVPMTGLGAEAAVSYSRPLAGALSLVVGLTARLLLANKSELNWTYTRGIYASLPLRVGVRW